MPTHWDNRTSDLQMSVLLFLVSTDRHHLVALPGEDHSHRSTHGRQLQLTQKQKKQTKAFRRHTINAKVQTQKFLCFTHWDSPSVNIERRASCFNLSTTDYWGRITLCREVVLCMGRCSAESLGSTHYVLVTPSLVLHPRCDKCPQGSKITTSWKSLR